MAEETEKPDIFNRHLVGRKGEMVVVMNPLRYMTRREALVHAAWLVVLAEDPEGKEFLQILEMVRNT